MNDIQQHQVAQVLLGIVDRHPEEESEVNRLRELLLPQGMQDDRCASCRWGHARHGICNMCVDHDQFEEKA